MASSAFQDLGIDSGFGHFPVPQFPHWCELDSDEKQKMEVEFYPRAKEKPGIQR